MFASSADVVADWSATGYIGSDYLFNGVSQTNEKPAVQLSFDFSSPSGFYAGVKGSNIEFADESDIEVDYYLGIYQELNSQNSLNLGIAQYTYLGGENSSESNYQEAYLIFDIGNTSISYWYAWDYFGSDARHAVAMLNHTFLLNEQFSLLVGIDKSTSFDKDKFSWQFQDKDYIHHQASILFSVQNFDISLGFHYTDLDISNNSAFLLSIVRTINF